MITSIKKSIIEFYTKEKELNITFFKLLGTAGIVISIIGGLQSLITSNDYTGALINLFAALASLGLMWFVHTTKRYIIGYLITSVGIFMILFAWLFFDMGGLNGSMPYFFTFGIIFTLLMYKGVLLYIMEIIQTAFYIAVCVIAYNHPEYVKNFETPESQFVDQLVGIVLSAVGIGLIFLMYIREYRKQQKISEESSNAKSVLLANISHEVRTPINMLLGMNEMILRESENSQINEYAQNVDNAGQHLLFMVNQFLDLSRIDMGKETLFEEDFNIMKMVQSLGVFFGKEAEKKRLEFVLDIDKKMPESFCGDMRKLSQILSNLLSNSVKYTSKGTIVFSVQNMGRKKDENPEKYTIHFEVSDTGCGIKEEDQKKIFESFERADIIKNRSIEGTGLGLAISNKLANLMGSEIKVKSQYGIGSVFWFDLELKKGKDGEVHLETDAFFIAPEARILVVDDNNMNLQVAKALLKRTMIGVDTAESASEAYKKYETNRYDLILMDYMMPETDGIEAMEHIRKMDKARNRSIPIIVLTADASPDKREFFMSKGFDDYLLKPIDSVTLENSLKKHLPKNLITLIDNEVKAKLPEETRLKLSAILKKYDISMDQALKHLSGDILQYGRVCEYFLKASKDNMEKLKKFMDKEDYENAAILVHAVKGNAGNVGGEDLFYSARRLEKRLKDTDTEYSVSALPLFLMKWNRVEKGLEIFLDEFDKVKSQLLSQETEKEKPLSEEEAWNELLNAVRLGNQSPALKLVERLTKISGKQPELEKIRDYIRNIEFEEAERCIKSVRSGT